MADLTPEQANASVSITDPVTFTDANVLTTAPVGTEGGQVVRNIPSGTQAVGGTVSDAEQTLTVGATVPMTVTTAGRLKVDVADRQNRWIQEQMMLNQMEASMNELMSHERDSSCNQGFELR